MKIVVIGGTGLIGSQVVQLLTAHGHEAVPASPASGVDTLTGAGLADVLAGAAVVVDVSNSPSFADADVLRFFTTSTGNLLAAEEAAGVGHHVALSVVGNDRHPGSGYLRAKAAQEELLRNSGVPYSVVRATQFFEFARGIAASSTDDQGNARISPALFQPVASADVAAAVARTAAGEPVKGFLEIAGPEKLHLDEFVRIGLAAAGSDQQVVTDPAAPYFGVVLDDDSLVPAPDATTSTTTYSEWLAVPGNATGGRR